MPGNVVHTRMASTPLTKSEKHMNTRQQDPEEGFKCKEGLMASI